jgi:WD40 repeat protein
MDYRMSCYAIAFSPDSRTLVNGGAEFGAYNAINTWDIASGSHLKTFAFTTVGSSIAFTPDGAKIVAPDKDGRVHIWNARTGQALKTIPGPGGSITTLAVSPDGRRVAIGTVVPACFLQMRDLRSGRALWTKTITGEGMVSSLAFSPDGATLARGGQENRIYLHNVRTGSVRATLSDPVPTELKSWAGSDAAQTVKYSPDGRFLAGGAPERVVVWSARTNKVALRPKHAATPFAFMADSRSLAAAQSDVPLLRPAGPHSFTTQPARHDGRIALWSLK